MAGSENIRKHDIPNPCIHVPYTRSPCSMFHRKQEGISDRIGSSVCVRRNSQNSRILSIKLLISLVLAWQSWLPASAQDFYGSTIWRVFHTSRGGLRGAAAKL